MPLVLLVPLGGPDEGAGPVPRSMPLAAPAASPPLAAAYERSLFGAPAQAEDAAPGDAPELVGVVGRLGADAVALVRTADGATRALQIGESVDGWQLASLAIDAAFFTRGAQRVRVPLPAG
ncbi:hypothetical protein E5A73_09060 [Sphingomonas gei]|uniref:General secretion pathway protein GspN n=1 Tax=Sphingomonas gei TaxID=1395960 RepID=A0A4S1XD65_9SPHN|nr:hypothetical protein [Sphingomonas gei]TGX54414.1 hypothetical protein E5A73_09060 [Sphingomonas gei]